MSVRQREQREEREISARKWADDQGKFDRPYIKIPAGMKQFRPEKDKEYILDIIPFIAGEGNPRADKGMPHWERTFRVHKNVGPSQKTYLCIADAASKPCAPCSERLRLRDKGAGKEELRAFNTSERQLFLVRLKGTKEIMLWDESTWCFGKYLKATLDRKEGKFDMFADPNKGYSLEIGTKEESMGSGKPYVICPNINFIKREKQIGSGIYDKAPCLDDMLVVLTPKEMEDLFFQTADAEEDTDEKLKKGKKQQETEDEDEDTVTDSDDDEENDSELEPEETEDDDEDSETEEDSDEDDEPASKKKSKKEKTAKECGLKVKDMVEHPKFGECEITKISPDGTSLTLEDEDGDKHMAVGPEEVELIGKETEVDEDEDEDEVPAPKKKKKLAPVEDEDEDDPIEDDEDSDESDEDEDSDDDADEDEDEDSDEDEDLEQEEHSRKPVKKPAKPVKKPSRR